jgi:hypothetical protein
MKRDDCARRRARAFHLLPELPAMAETLPDSRSIRGPPCWRRPDGGRRRKLNTEFVGVLRAPEVKALLEATGRRRSAPHPNGWAS